MIRQKSQPNGEKGIALFLTLIFILILSVLGVSIIFVSQSETWSGLNYLEMTQARYGAEAGMNAGANYIVNTYCAPGNTTCTNGNSPAAGDTIALYNTNVSPVTLVSGGATVTLSTTAGASTYPVASVVSAFQSAAAGSVTDNSRSVNYKATATLMAMNTVTTAAGTQTVQTWDLTGTGSTGDIRAATVTVDGIVEQQVTFAASSTPSYGVFGTGNGCGDLTLSGGVVIASYDSKNPTMSGGHWSTDNWGGDIGSNGNLNESGNPTTVYGSLSTPRTGVGNCASGGVDAWSDSGGATVSGCQTATSCVSGGLVKLSQNVTYANPTMPNPSGVPTTSLSITKSSTCASLGLASGCSGSAGALVLAGGSYGNISLSGQAVVTLNPSASNSTFNINSISVSGNSILNISNTMATTINIVGSGASTMVSLSGQQVMNLNGTYPVTMNLISNTDGTPFTTTGGSTAGNISNTNSSGVPTPADLVINYAGANTITVSGGTTSAACIYAPNATVTISGGSAYYGSVIASTFNDSGGTSFYYDRELGSTSSPTEVATVQQFMMDSFSWTRF